MSLPKRSSKKLKVERGSKESSASSKVAAPRERLAANSLKWKSVKNTASFAGIDEGGGMMMLEELDDVGVEWQEESGAKIARFVAVEPKKGKGKAMAQEEKEDEQAVEAIDEDAASVTSSADIEFEELDDDAASVTSSADIEFEEVNGDGEVLMSDADVGEDVGEEEEEEESEAELEVEEAFNGEL
jgi:ATP-dependent RNA helicase DDX24/MAK5